MKKIEIITKIIYLKGRQLLEFDTNMHEDLTQLISFESQRFLKGLDIVKLFSYEIDLTLRKAQTSQHFFLSLLNSLLPYSPHIIWVQNGCNLVITCDNIYTNLFHKLDMVDL